MPGFVKSEEIRLALESLELKPGEDNITTNMQRCYDALIHLDAVQADEVQALNAWTQDLRNLNIV